MLQRSVPRLAALCLICLTAPQVLASTHTRFGDDLISDGPSPTLPKAASAVFGWLVGDWDAVVYDYGPGGAKSVSRGEWHFSWDLDGRAIQDVWIVPAIPQRSPHTPKTNSRYGSTLRIYDGSIDAWRVFWFNPVTGDRSSLVARKIGDRIVQQGLDDDGSYIRWSFEDIRRDSFVWRGEYSLDGGATWRLDAEFIAHRSKSPAIG